LSPFLRTPQDAERVDLRDLADLARRRAQNFQLQHSWGRFLALVMRLMRVKRARGLRSNQGGCAWGVYGLRAKSDEKGRTFVLTCVMSHCLHVYVTPRLRNGLVCKLGVWFAKRLEPRPVCKPGEQATQPTRFANLATSRSVLQNYLWMLQTEDDG
jgi:hypothetical protein